MYDAAIKDGIPGRYICAIRATLDRLLILTAIIFTCLEAFVSEFSREQKLLERRTSNV